MKLAIGLIHNNDKARVSRSISQIETILNHSKQHFECIVLETVYQPPVTLMSEEEFIAREQNQRIISKSWDQYRKLNGVNAFYPRVATHSNLTRATIEIFLTDKHIRTWDYCIEHSADWLLVMEDDAIFTHETVTQLIRIITTLCEAKNPTYVDLAGGFNLQALQAEALIDKNNERVITFIKPITNTTCAYMMNISLAKELRKLIIFKPNYRLIASDWLLNQCFIDLNYNNTNVKCIHFFPPIMIHGSINGMHESTVQLTNS
jgi:hypothetical protein